MYSGTRHVARELGLTGPLGCVDGSHIVDATDDRELAAHPIPGASIGAVFEAVREFRPATFVFAEDAIFHDAVGADYIPYVQIWSRTVRVLDDVCGDPRWSCHPRVKGLFLLGPARDIQRTHEFITEQHAAALQSAAFNVSHPKFQGTWGMVVRAQGASKATALSFIAEHHGVSLSEVVAVGDWYNDVAMFSVAGRSFAMAQAPDAVKEVATDVLDASSEQGGGVAEAAERAGLL